jgi:hypothetical protein
MMHKTTINRFGKQTWLVSILIGMVVGLAFLFRVSLGASIQSCEPPQPGDPCAESPNFQLSGASILPVAGYGVSAAGSVDYPQLPVDGPLTFVDLKSLEQQAFALLADHKSFRQAISPYQEAQGFEDLVRSFDEPDGNNATGFDKIVNGKTVRQRLESADAELRQARDLYAYLAVYADAAQFRADPDYITPCAAPDDPTAGVVDRCNFSARLRESVRELAFLHTISASSSRSMPPGSTSAPLICLAANHLSKPNWPS